MRTYGQFCPIARTSELIAERWTPIIIRNLLVGCRTFTEIRQGAPGISTALLAQRLEALERHGVLECHPGPAGRKTYRLTEKGRELKAVCDAMGHWGARWLEIEPHHLDPAYVLWVTTKLVDVDRLPDRTVVVRFDLRDRPDQRYWLILRRPLPELCTRGLGHVEDVVATTDDTDCLVDLHLTRTAWPEAIRCGRLVLAGPPGLTREFTTWIRPSPFASSVPGTAAERASHHASESPDDD
ncbi:winged helix-turn-helix transcriptional regulator [Actinomycetospora flava]|uniref:Helix-turn-helix domain-containing protein n=1 Tax=Actinomycetospora flava TaxID=3129232 RepID=A0ABU8LY99_9PSEU